MSPRLPSPSRVQRASLRVDTDQGLSLQALRYRPQFFRRVCLDSQEQFPVEHGFRMRGAGMSRIDVLSDVVFAFSLVLLAISLTVPKNFQAIHDHALGFVTFAICFAMILGGWFSHYVFFRRYGLHDRITIVLNSCLLFLILFCVYPLKFFYSTIIGYLFRNEFSARFAAAVQLMGMLVLYALGFSAVFFLVPTLYWNACR